MLKKLSVIIPIRNMANELNRIFDEINYLASKGAQIIIVDDGSEDGTFNLLQQFSIENGLNNRLKIISQGHLGPGAARNAGFLTAINDIVVFWDSDDVRDLKILEETINLEFPEDMLVCNFTLKNLNLRQTQIKNLETKNLLDLSVNGGMWRIFFKRNFLINLKFPDLFCGDDLVFLANLLNRNPKVAWSESIIYQYNNSREGQTSANIVYRADSVQACLSLINLLKNPNTKNSKYIGVILLKLLNTAIKSDWKGLLNSATKSLFDEGIICSFRIIIILNRSILAFCIQKSRRKIGFTV
jgi:glycosyltransferase involved in cell wall biosynthesis